MSTPTSNPPPAQPSRRQRLLWSWGRDLLIALGLSAFFILFLYQPVRVEGTSMLPGLQDQERIFINKLVYKLEPIERGDIVVFHPPFNPSESYIKRVIGISGDRVRIVDGQVYVNGNAIKEPYVPGEYFDFQSMAQTTVPPHSYFLLGDHRSLSKDSRNFGAVDQSYIYGKAVFVYWPVDKLGILR
jgi:signal peptidase I